MQINGNEIYFDAAYDEINSYFTCPGTCYKSMLERSTLMGDEITVVLWQGEKRKRAAEGIVSVLLSVLTVFAGTAYQQYAGVPEGSRKVIYLFLQILLWTVLYFAGFRITEGVLKKKEAAGREEYTLHFSAGRQMIGLVLCWLPYLLIYAPGLVNLTR